MGLPLFYFLIYLFISSFFHSFIYPFFPPSFVLTSFFFSFHILIHYLSIYFLLPFPFFHSFFLSSSNKLQMNFIYFLFAIPTLQLYSERSNTTLSLIPYTSYLPSILFYYFIISGFSTMQRKRTGYIPYLHFS